MLKLFSAKINLFIAFILASSVFSSYSHAQLYTNDFGAALVTVSNCDDCFEGPVSFPGGSSINFFGNSYSGLYIGSNGYVTFGMGGTSFSADPLNTQAVAPMIAGSFTDLDSSSDAASLIYLNTSTPHQIIVTYVDLGHFDKNYTVRSTFQLVIRADAYSVAAGEGQVGFFYGQVTDPAVTSSGFGDGLPASNPGEIAITSRAPGTTLNNRAGAWYSLSATGVPNSPNAQAQSVPVLPLPLQIALVFAMLSLVATRVKKS
ncbi:hypothetical protein [Pseudoteredinibacter isoporae]|uniref:hypothetical protein n=1 Tax=Pseudoteredinibacter isoporae TaxID=570281 RepID=UPI003109AFCF